MGLIADIGTKLAATAGVTALVSTRIYAEQVPSTVTLSQAYIVYRVVGDEHPTHMSGATGLVDTQVEFACIASGSEAAEAISEALRAAIHAQRWTGSTTTVKWGAITSTSSDGDPPTSGQNVGRYVRLVTYRFWHTESVPVWS